MNCKCAFWVAICLGLIWLYVVAIDELFWLKRDQSFQLLWNGLSLSVPPSPIFRWPPPTFQMCIVQASQLFGDLCVKAHTYVIFVILTPAPFSGDTKKTHQIQIFWHQIKTQNSRFLHQNTPIYNILTPAPHVVHVTNIRCGHTATELDTSISLWSSLWGENNIYLSWLLL